MKPIYKGITIFLISIAMALICSVDFVSENHFNLITVNSVLIGFMFTSLSILLGFLEYKIVQLFEEAGALKKVYRNIETGICFSIGSIGISILNLLVVENYIKVIYILRIAYSLEILFMIITLYLLIKTLMNIKVVIESIRFEKEKNDKKGKADAELDEILKD